MLPMCISSKEQWGMVRDGIVAGLVGAVFWFQWRAGNADLKAYFLVSEWDKFMTMVMICNQHS